MSYERPFLFSPSQGPTEIGSLNGQALDLVERGFRGSEVEVAEDYRSRTFGSRYETVSSSISFSPLCSVFGRPLLSGGPSGLGNYHGHEEMGDLEPLRVVSVKDGDSKLSKMEAPIIKDGGFKYGGFKLSRIWPPTLHFFFLVR